MSVELMIGDYLIQSLDLKVIILGNGRVGKTSIIYRYINDEFADTVSVTKVIVLLILSFVDYRCIVCIEKVVVILPGHMGMKIFFTLSKNGYHPSQLGYCRSRKICTHILVLLPRGTSGHPCL